MNELDELPELHAALHAPPDFTPGPLNLDQIMTAGGRIRRRRRIAVGASTGLAALTMVLGATQLHGIVPERPHPAPPPAASHSPSPPAPTVHLIDGGITHPLGDIIPTGLHAAKNTTWVIAGIPVHNKYAPKTTFGFAVIQRTTNGTLTEEDTLTAATDGTQLKPGFANVEHPYTLVEGNVEQPAFGYYVGKVAKITGKADGKTLTANTAVWSYNPNVTVFWFDNTKVTGHIKTFPNVNAYNSTGKLIATTKIHYENG